MIDLNCFNALQLQYVSMLQAHGAYITYVSPLNAPLRTDFVVMRDLTSDGANSAYVISFLQLKLYEALRW